MQITCQHCGKESTFLAPTCPFCGASRAVSRPVQPPEVASPEGLPDPLPESALEEEVPDVEAEPSKRTLAIELAVVLVLFWLPWLTGCLFQWIDPIPTGDSYESWRSISIYMVFNLGTILILFYLVFQRGGGPENLAFRKTRWWIEGLWGVGLVIVHFAISLGLIWYFFEYEPGGENSGVIAPLPLVVIHILIAASMEEILFRGYIWDRLERILGSQASAFALTTLMFAFSHHGSLLRMTSVFCGGVIFGLVRWHGKSLPRLLIAHVGFNLCVLSTRFFSPF